MDTSLQQMSVSSQVNECLQTYWSPHGFICVQVQLILSGLASVNNHHVYHFSVKCQSAKPLPKMMSYHKKFISKLKEPYTQTHVSIHLCVL